MHEDLATVITGEKAIPLVGVVPLDLAGRHRADLTSRRRTKTTSDRVTDRMLGALLRLSVRDAGSQLRYACLRVTTRQPCANHPRAGASPAHLTQADQADQAE